MRYECVESRDFGRVVNRVRLDEKYFARIESNRVAHACMCFVECMHTCLGWMQAQQPLFGRQSNGVNLGVPLTIVSSLYRVSMYREQGLLLR